MIPSGKLGGKLGLLVACFNLLSSDPTALALNSISTWAAVSIGCVS